MMMMFQKSHLRYLPENTEKSSNPCDIRVIKVYGFFGQNTEKYLEVAETVDLQGFEFPVFFRMPKYTKIRKNPGAAEN